MPCRYIRGQKLLTIGFALWRKEPCKILPTMIPGNSIGGMVWIALFNSTEHTELSSAGSTNVTRMENTSRDVVANAERPTEMTSSGESGVTKWGEATTERVESRSEIAQVALPGESNTFRRKYDPEQMEAAATNRREFLVGGLAASASTLVGKRALAASNDSRSVYRIHPAIGIARVGNAPASTFFIGPEVPGLPPLGDAPGTTAPPYKVGGLIKPQAVRFRIYEYQWIAGILTPIGEVTLDTPGVLGISWSAHLANKKASFHKFNGLQGEKQAPAGFRNPSVADRRSLEIDFGARTISGPSLGPVEFRVGTSGNPSTEACPLNSSGEPVIDYLGELRTDDEGRLIVIGGQGRAASSVSPAPTLTSFANNDNWYDDISDGPVTAVVTIDDGNGGTIDVPVDDAGGAWVFVGPPDFAPGIRAPVTLYDILFDMGVRELPIPQENALYNAGGPLHRLNGLATDYRPTGPVEFPTTIPIFQEEIQDLFTRGYEMRWVTSLLTVKHNGLVSPTLGIPGPAYAQTRQLFFNAMRSPAGSTQTSGTMPRHLGDDPYNGNAPGYTRRLAITKTQYGLLRNWSTGRFMSIPQSPQPVVITPHGLDKAQLLCASGGAFYPGIEVSWQIRNAALFIEPFRIDLNALSQYWGENQPIGPGHFSRQMALPWHADFADCANEGQSVWWPAQRPDDVFTSATATSPVNWTRSDSPYPYGGSNVGHEDMVAVWYKFGFVVEQGGAWVESERATQIP